MCPLPLRERAARVATTRWGEGCGAPPHPNVPERTPALPSPARGEGAIMSAELPDIVAGEGHEPPRTTATLQFSPRPLSQSHRARHAHARHDRRAGRDLDRFARSLRRLVSDTAQSLESVGTVFVGRDHGGRHGAGHRHPQHRSVGRLDARLPRHDHGGRSGRSAAEASRLRQSRHLGRHARGWTCRSAC